jgi:heat shock protein beta
MSALASPFQVTNREPAVSPHGGKRFLSGLAAPKLNGARGMPSLKLRESALVGRRYESSSAAVDSSDAPPAEKFEYQAEVPMLNSVC